MKMPIVKREITVGTRKVPFSRELYIERDDFKDAAGNVTVIHCTYDPATRGGNAPDGRKVKGTIHWVSATHALDAEARLYDRLFTIENVADIPDGEDYKAYLNPDSCKIAAAKVEPSLRDAKPGDRFQFERIGYFCVDSKDSQPGKPVFNRTVQLKDSRAKIEKKTEKPNRAGWNGISPANCFNGLFGGWRGFVRICGGNTG